MSLCSCPPLVLTKLFGPLLVCFLFYRLHTVTFNILQSHRLNGYLVFSIVDTIVEDKPFQFYDLAYSRYFSWYDKKST